MPFQEGCLRPAHLQPRLYSGLPGGCGHCRGMWYIEHRVSKLCENGSPACLTLIEITDLLYIAGFLFPGHRLRRRGKRGQPFLRRVSDLASGTGK